MDKKFHLREQIIFHNFNIIHTKNKHNFNIIIDGDNVIVLMSCEVSSVCRTLHYICRGPRFEPRSSHLSILRLKFLAIRLHDKKKYLCLPRHFRMLPKNLILLF
jgi:hypothetical protein